MEIKLDEGMSEYLSRYFNIEIKEIFLDSKAESIRREFAYFINELLNDRTWSVMLHPYVYNKNTKKLGIYAKNPWDDLESMDSMTRVTEEMEKNE